MARETKKLPMIAVRGIVGFPQTVINIDVERKISKIAIERAMETDRVVFLAAQKNFRKEHPTSEDVYEIGIIAQIRHVIQIKDGSMRILADGICRGVRGECSLDDCFYAVVEELEEVAPPEPIAKAYKQSLLEQYHEYGKYNNELTMQMYLALTEIDDLSKLTDNVALTVLSKISEKQEILEELDIALRAEKLIRRLSEMIEVQKLAAEVNAKTKAHMDKLQRDSYLREQINAIQQIIEEDAPKEADEFEDKIAGMPVSDAIKDKLIKEVNRLRRLSTQSSDYSVLKTYLEWVTSLPFGVYTEDNDDIKHAEKILDRDHYGMKKVKERILEYLAVLSLKKEIKGSILCLAGPPGVGKTSIAKSIAEALGRKFVRMSLGGLHDEAEIRGHRRTYVGAIPGRIVSNIKLAGTMNPVFLLDEIDKMSSEFRGDPASAMLEVLDPAINNAFQDNYLDIDFDLSNVLFITTANDIESIPRPLYDRMEIIEVSGYTGFEKVQIAKKHLIPRLLVDHGLTSKVLRIEQSAIEQIVEQYTAESGVRTLERTLAKVMRRAAKEHVEGKERMVIRTTNLKKYLGAPRFTETNLPQEPSVGTVVGLAWTSYGGDTMPIEVCTMPGTGDIQLTGQLGDVMKESAKTGISLIRAKAEELGIPADFHEKLDIHIHIPEGAVPKDGPSAGITMALAVVSALTGRKVRHDVAMTGEITLTGRVLPIGGLKEKTLSAVRGGIKEVIIPKVNVKDIEEIPEEIVKQVTFVPVERFEEVLERALLNAD